jgi:aldehyde:ferredoxin oxidoreductase
MVNGYAGKILWVDLVNISLQDEIPDEKFCREFIGGYGFGARLLFSRQRAGVDPPRSGEHFRKAFLRILRLI